MSRQIRLHTKIYRAGAIDEAIDLATAELEEGATLTRSRADDYYLVTLDGLPDPDAAEVLAEVGDAALLITVEKDR